MQHLSYELHHMNRVSLPYFFHSLSRSLVSVELPPFPGSGIIGDPVLFSVGVSALRQLLHSLVSSNCTLEKKDYVEGGEPSYWNAKTNGRLGQREYVEYIFAVRACYSCVVSDCLGYLNGRFSPCCVSHLE